MGFFLSFIVVASPKFYQALLFLLPFRLCAERAWERGYLHHMAALHMSANSPMTWEIVYTVLFMLADIIIPLTVSWLS